MRVILASRKSCIFAVKLFGRWLKSSRKLVKKTYQARAENGQFERSVWWKIRGKSWEGIHVVLLQKLLQKQESVKLQCIESSKKTSEPILTKCRKCMNFQSLMNVWDLTDVNTFWISWKTVRPVPNLVFTDEKKFDVEQCLNHQKDRVLGRDGSVEGRRVSRRHNPLSVMVWAAITATGRSPLVFVPSGVKLNSQGYISDILEAELLP